MSNTARSAARPAPTLPPTAPRLALSSLQANAHVRYEQARPLILVGSRRDCHLPLAHAEVSKIHCAIVNTGEAVLVCDLRSRSGTFVNDRPVRVACLKPGDTLRAGPVPIEIEFQNQAPQASGDAGGEDSDPTRLAVPLELAAGGRRHEITVNGAVVGRRNTCDLVLNTPDVSLAHAIIFALGGCPLICDLGSRSGTILNEQPTSLAWLCDGDQLCIGGEELTVVWKGPQGPPQHDAPAAKTPQAKEPPAAPGNVDGAGPDVLDLDLEDLSRTINGLQGRIVVLHSQFRERSDLIERRQAELEALRQCIVEERSSLDAQRQKLGARARRVRQAQQRIEEQRRELARASENCARERQAAERLRSQVQAAGTQLARDRERVEADRQELQRQIAAHRKAVTALEQRQAALAQQRETLAECERALSRREAELAAREAADAEAARKIAAFKSALHDATEFFDAVQCQSAGRESSPPAGNREPASHKAATPAAPEITDQKLPAPMVDQPMFSANGVATPDDWPPELRERLCVLRRVSDKSDKDLMAQVLAEYKSKNDAPETDGSKRKRRWWA